MGPDVVTVFNGLEVLLWSVLAVVVVVRFRKSEAGLRRLSWITAALLAAFALSDVIEMHTGAWWRPVGLLFLKGACLAGLTYSFVAMVRRVRATNASGSADRPDGKQ